MEENISTTRTMRPIGRLRFSGKNTQGNNSPTLYATERDTFIVQGWRTEQLNYVEISHPLLGFLEPGTCLGAPLTDTGHGTFTLTGDAVTDPQVLAQMDIPDFETCVEVPRGKEIRGGAVTG